MNCSLAILGSHGTYLSLRGEPRDLPLASSTVHVYTFVLSKKAAAVTGGTLKSLIQRIATGTVEVFIDDAASVKSIVVNGDGYNSTSTILSVNTPVMIETPAQVE